jgi:hypothetical protein
MRHGAVGIRRRSRYIFTAAARRLGRPDVIYDAPMGRGDNRRTPKMKRRKSQAKLKARIKRKIETAKAAKKPAAPSKKK